MDARALFLRLILFVVLATSPIAAWADPLHDGLDAYDRKDYAMALRLLVPLASQGAAEAQNTVGVMYEWGRGVARNYAEAVKWYRLAADQGLAPAQQNLGHMYYFGNGVAQSNAEALRWHRLAANQGYAVAQATMGQTYLLGFGVEKDEAEAAKWYRLAADQGNAVAQSNLGSLYEKGSGVPQDYVQAYKWFAKAVASGFPGAKAHLDKVTALMTPDQLEQLRPAAKPDPAIAVPAALRDELAATVLGKLEKTREYIALAAYYDRKKSSDPAWPASSQGRTVGDLLTLLRADAMHTRVIKTPQSAGIEYAVQGIAVTDTRIEVAALNKDPEYRDYVSSAIAGIIASNSKVTALLATLKDQGQ